MSTKHRKGKNEYLVGLKTLSLSLLWLKFQFSLGKQWLNQKCWALLEKVLFVRYDKFKNTPTLAPHLL